MSNNIRFVIENAHDKAALTVTSEAQPIKNTQDKVRGRIWRSSSTSNQTITGTLTSGTFANSFVFGRHNLSSSATIKLVLKLSGSSVYDSGDKKIEELIPAGVWRVGIEPYGATYNDKINPQVGSIWFDPVAFDEYEITIKDNTNSDGYIQASRIFLGLSFEPSINMSRGVKLDWIENTEHVRTDGGSLRSDGNQGLYRQLTINLDWLNEADRTALLSNFYNAGKGSDFFVSCYPEVGGMKEIEYSFIAKRKNNLSLTNNLINNWKSQLVLVEA